MVRKDRREGERQRERERNGGRACKPSPSSPGRGGWTAGPAGAAPPPARAAAPAEPACMAGRPGNRLTFSLLPGSRPSVAGSSLDPTSCGVAVLPAGPHVAPPKATSHLHATLQPWRATPSTPLPGLSRPPTCSTCCGGGGCAPAPPPRCACCAWCRKVTRALQSAEGSLTGKEGCSL